MPCCIPLFPCYSLSLLEIISIHHCYTCHREKHTHTTFSFPSLPSLTPSPGLFSCTHLPPVVFSRALQNVLLFVLKRWLPRAQFYLLFASTFSICTHSSLFLLIIICYLVLATCLVLYKPENEGCLSSRKLLYRANRWNSPSIVPIFTDELYSVLPFFSNNLWEVGFFSKSEMPSASVKILLQMLSVCLVFCKA